MGVYRRVFASSVAAALIYRGSVVAGVAAQLLQLLATVFVWRSIFAGTASIAGYSLAEMTGYLVASSLLGVAFSASHFFRLPALVERGTLSFYLVRPYSFLGDAFARYLGEKAVELAIVGGSLAVAALLGLTSLGGLLGGGLLLVAANIVLLFFFGYAVSTAGFWLVEVWPIKPLYGALMLICGGSLYPLDLLPEGVRAWALYTPFALVGFVSARAVQGALTFDEQRAFLLASFVWSGLFFALYRFLWARGLARYEAVGG